MPFQILAGRKFNLLERAVNPILPTSANVAFPITNVADGLTDHPFMFNVAALTQDVLIDLNQVPNGDFETAFVGGLPTAVWGKIAAPTLTRTGVAGEFNSGAFGLRVVGTAGTDEAYVDVPVLAGDRMTITSALRRGPNAGENAAIFVLNTASRMWLQSGGTWSSSRVAYFTVVAPAFSTSTVSFTVESAAACGGNHAVTLRLFFEAGGSGSTGPLYDDVAVWGNVDFFSVHGHNLGSGGTLTLQSGTTNNPVTSRASITTFRRPVFYTTFSNVTDRWWRVRVVFLSTPALGDPIWYGEIVLGQRFQLNRKPDEPLKYRFSFPQLRTAGNRLAYARADALMRILECTFRYYSQADLLEAREQIFVRTRGGVDASVIVPDDTDVEVCIYGRIAPEWMHSRDRPVIWKNSVIAWTELPFPTFMP